MAITADIPFKLYREQDTYIQRHRLLRVVSAEQLRGAPLTAERIQQQIDSPVGGFEKQKIEAQVGEEYEVYMGRVKQQIRMVQAARIAKNDELDRLLKAKYGQQSRIEEVLESAEKGEDKQKLLEERKELTKEIEHLTEEIAGLNESISLLETLYNLLKDKLHNYLEGSKNKTLEEKIDELDEQAQNELDEAMKYIEQVLNQHITKRTVWIKEIREDEAKLTERVEEGEEQQVEIVEQQAEIVEEQAEIVEQQAEIVEQQAETVEQQPDVELLKSQFLTIVFEKRDEFAEQVLMGAMTPDEFYQSCENLSHFAINQMQEGGVLTPEVLDVIESIPILNVVSPQLAEIMNKLDSTGKELEQLNELKDGKYTELNAKMTKLHKRDTQVQESAKPLAAEEQKLATEAKEEAEAEDEQQLSTSMNLKP